ncbi:dihydrofolate reductase [Lysinibacillus sp. M3]|uniref:dihydrofolate reductase n=1 Tax=Lysinibacillus zambalensis TaxID=3160866 RepID=A0ABV1MRF7_9BACI
MSINMIVAIDESYAIGYKGNLIYRLKKDLKRFRELTSKNDYGLKNYILSGRNTYESLPKELPDRKMVVLSSNKNYKVNKNIIVEHSLDKVINHYLSGEQEKDLWIIGGEEIYKQSLDYVDKVYLTFISSKAKKADAYFPFLDMIKKFRIVDFEADKEDGIDFAYITFERKKSICV